MKNLDSLFSPKSVAIVGVSKDPSKLGSVIFSNMIEAGFEGELYLVNPKYSELFGHKSYPDISSIPQRIELAVLVIPAKFVVDAIKDCVKKEVGSVIIISAGFKETGEEGKKLEDEVLRIAKEGNINLLGPNCLGVICPKFGINASFAASNPREGNIALLSQSGAFCTAILDMAIPANLGFSHFVSFGNKADIDEIDLIDYWMHDDEVKVIGAYLEEIKYGHDLINKLYEFPFRKPIVLLKPGQTEEAKKAISSHTGSLAGSNQTFKTAIEQNGIFEAKSIREHFNLLMGFSSIHLPKGNRVAVITNAGGPGIISTDSLINHGFMMAEVSKETEEKLKEYLPPTASVHNPIDIIGDALADRYNEAVHIVAQDENVDAILVLLTPQLVTQIEDTAKVLINAIKMYKKPIIPVMIGKKYTTPALNRFFDNKIAAYTEIEDAVEVLSALFKYNEIQKSHSLGRIHEKLSTKEFLNKGKYKSEIKKFLGNKNALTDDLAILLMQEVEIELPKQKVCKNIEEAKKFSKNIFPVVIKATNSSIVHKTDFKAVYLNINNTDELDESYFELEETIKKHTKLKDVEILVQEQLKTEELIFIGSNRDGESNVYEKETGGFGHLLAFGLGGIYTEIYKDINYAIIPATREELETSFNKTKVSKILDGARGKEALPKYKVIDAIESIQKLMLLYPEISSMDINPLIVTKDKVVAVDVKVFVG